MTAPQQRMRRGTDRTTGKVREAIREELARDAIATLPEPERPPVIELENVSLSFDRPIL